MTEQRTAPAAAIAALEAQPAWTRRHVLDLDDFTPHEIEAVMDTTDAMKEVLSREVPRVPALRGKTVVTLFYEASPRPRASFELAAKALGADVINFAAAGSSAEKGESLYDTVRTLQAVGAQMLVMRHGSSGAPYLPPPPPRGPRPGAPPSGEPLALPRVDVETDLDRAVEGADVVMALRLQLERMTAGLLPSLREYARLFQVNEERLARARPGALVMHPGPMNEGVEISPAVARSLQSTIEEQVTNGVAVRMAVLYLLARGKA